MNLTAVRPKILLSADGTGIIPQAGAVLLTKTLRVTGLDRQLSDGLQRRRAPRAVHDPGKIIADLAAAVALGGDCLADIAVLRAQPDLAGPVASDPVVSRLIAQLAADAPRALTAIRAARAAARARAWALAGGTAPGSDGGLVTVDIDATVVTAHSEKAQATSTWKKTFGLLTRWRPSPTMAPKGPANRWPSSCGQGTPGPTPPLTISRSPGWPWRSCPATCAARCSSALIPAAAPMISWPGWPGQDGGWLTPPGSPSPARSRTPSSRFPQRRGPPPMTAAARSGRARGSPRSPACWTWPPGRRGCG